MEVLSNVQPQQLNRWAARARPHPQQQQQHRHFSVAAKEHVRLRSAYAVRAPSTLLWWELSSPSLEQARSHAFDAPVVAVADHKRLDEVAVFLKDGRCVLFNLQKAAVVATIGGEKVRHPSVAGQEILSPCDREF